MIEYCLLIPSLFTLQHYTSSETCLSAFQAPVDPSAVLGGFSGNNYSEVMVSELGCSVPFDCYSDVKRTLFQATAFVVTYPVNNVIGDSSNENARAVAWEKSFIQLAKVFPVSKLSFSFLQSLSLYFQFLKKGYGS